MTYRGQEPAHDVSTSTERPPVVLTRRQRWRYARQEWTRRTRLRVGVALGSWIAGEDLAPGYYDDGE
jgi:hypothetical protein